MSRLRRQDDLDYKRAWNAQDKLTHAAKWNDWALRSRYGITAATRAQMQFDQRGLCAICKLEKELVVDHDHATKNVRALLCRACNLLIGFAQEQPDILDRAAVYLAFHNPNESACYGESSAGYFIQKENADAAID